MNRIFLTLFLVALFPSVVVFAFRQPLHLKDVSSIEGYIASNGSVKTAQSLARCCLECQKVPTCASFFYMLGQTVGNCQLHDQIFVGTMGLMNVGNTKYYVVSDLNDCVNEAKLMVRCDVLPDSGGWIVIQQRTSASDFYKTWEEYKEGFGDLNGNFWFGNEKIWALTKDGHWKLRVGLTYGDESGYAEYSSFAIGDEVSNYILTVGGYSGNIGDSLTSVHNGHKFSTRDRDNDVSSGHCAQKNHGAWWYSRCLHSNLNGDYGSKVFAKGVIWSTWKGYYNSLTTSKMMIRRV